MLSEILESRTLFISTADLLPDGTLRIFANEPETTISVIGNNLSVFIQGYQYAYIDPDNPDGQYHDEYTVVDKDFPLSDIVKINLIVDSDNSTSQYDFGGVASGNLEPFTKNMTSLPIKYTGETGSINTFFGTGADDVTDFVGNGGLYKTAGTFVFDYRDRTESSTFRILGGGLPELIPVEVWGSEYADTLLLPGLGPVTIHAGGGDDTLSGGSANDILDGGTGNDSITGGAGKDYLFGNDGNDTLIGGAGSDNLDAGAGNDFLVGGNGNDVLMGGAGKDVLDPGYGSDIVSGGKHADTVTYEFRTTNLALSLDGLANDGEAGEKDNLFADIENIRSGSGNDTIYGSAMNNYIDAGAGDDRMYAGDGNDTLVGGVERDTLYGQSGNDQYQTNDGYADVLLDNSFANTQNALDRKDRMITAVG